MRNKPRSKASKIHTASKSSTENIELGLVGIKTDQKSSPENSRSPTVKSIILIKKPTKPSLSPRRIQNSNRQIFVLKDLKYSKEADKFADFFMSEGPEDEEENEPQSVYLS